MNRSRTRVTGMGFLMAALVGTVALLCAAQAPRARMHHAPSAVARTEPDPQITAALKMVSAQKVRQDVEKLVSFYTRQTLSANQPEHTGWGIAAAREWIKSEFDNYSKACGGCLQVKTDIFVQPKSDRVPEPTQLVNVYAVLPGTSPEDEKRVFVVTGHYDSRNSDTFDAKGAAPGANDDASGTAVSLECARVLSRRRFPATIIFLTVAGEEQGLYGSEHFAQLAKEQGWQIEGVLNNDIVGGDKSPGQDPSVVRVFSEGLLAAAKASENDIKRIRALGEESDSPSRELARTIAEVGKRYLPASFQALLEFRPDRFLRGGDHMAFNEQGFAAVRLTEFRENFNRQHQNIRTEKGIEYGDLVKFVDSAYVANVARLNAATLAELASAPAPPLDVRLLTKQLENDSTLAWDASPDGRASSYEVLWRDTTAPMWQKVKPVGKPTQVTLPVSKDNVFFAVRAVDAQGHRSLPVVPSPER